MLVMWEICTRIEGIYNVEITERDCSNELSQGGGCLLLEGPEGSYTQT